MPKLQEKIFQKIESFNGKAEQLIEQQQFLDAVKEYQKAWNTLPEPRQLWDAGLWIKVGQAECLLALDEFDTAKNKLLDAILCAGAVSNPLVHLLLGICYYELNDKTNAKLELQIAYDLEGESVFQEGDEKYRELLNIENI
jgi:tetratricopeptide (TPR) repeat protein